MEVPIHKVLTEEIHLWYCRNMDLDFLRSCGLAQVIYCPFGCARAQLHSFQHNGLSLRRERKRNNSREWYLHRVVGGGGTELLFQIHTWNLGRKLSCSNVVLDKLITHGQLWVSGPAPQCHKWTACNWTMWMLNVRQNVGDHGTASVVTVSSFQLDKEGYGEATTALTAGAFSGHWGMWLD